MGMFTAPPAVEAVTPVPAPALRVAVATRGGLIGEAVAALLREHGLAAHLHHAGGDQRWPIDAAPHAVLLLDELGPLLEPTFDAVRRQLPGVRVLLLTRVADAAAVSGAVELGLHGLVDAQAHGRELAQAVRDVVGGRRVFPALVVLDDPAAAAGLSRRQRDVLRLVAQGLSNQEIAAELMITVNTVKFHVRTIFRQLGIHNRVEAARMWAAGSGPARPFG
jgi:two-component system, NarL family, response regulator DesR